MWVLFIYLGLSSWCLLTYYAFLWSIILYYLFTSNTPIYIQMAYELHGLLAGNVSIVTGENIKPSYGGDDESFLRKVITPLYRVIEKVR